MKEKEINTNKFIENSELKRHQRAIRKLKESKKIEMSSLQQKNEI